MKRRILGAVTLALMLAVAGTSAANAKCRPDEDDCPSEASPPERDLSDMVSNRDAEAASASDASEAASSTRSPASVSRHERSDEGAVVGGIVGAAVARTGAVRAARSPARSTQVVPVRVYLPASRIPPPWVAGYGIVAFKGLPTDDASLRRLVRVCEAFTHYLPRQDSVADTVPVADQMVTIWPLLHPDAPGARNDDCDYVTRNYELVAGTLALGDARTQNAAVGGRGPFLLAWSPSDTRGRRDRIVLVYDMSTLDSQDSFNQAFMFWQQQIVAKPSAWRNGMTFAQMRLAFRDFVDAHSDAALRVLHVSSPESGSH